MQDNIKEKVVKGLIWTYLERISAHFVSLIVSIILARKLEPKQFGMIAIVTIFTELSNVLIVNGTGTALIQKKDAVSKDFSTVFFINLIGTTALYFILFFTAPFIACFYNMPELVPVLRVLGVQMPLAGIASVQQSYISKQMEFKKFFFSTLIGTLISAIIGIILAYKDFGVWALVAQLLTNRIIDTTILVFTSGWKLTQEFSKDSFITLLSYSWKITLSSFLITLWDNVRSLLIGKKYSPSDLAYYDKGRQFPHFISSNINTSISKVLFPALSNVQNDMNCVLSMTRRAINITSYILIPLLMGLAACAETFVEIILTEKWLPIVPFLRLMCLIYVLQPIQTASLQAMKAIGRSDTYLRLEIIKKAFNFSVLIISVFCFDNALAIAFGALISEIISTILNCRPNLKLIGYKYSEQIKDFVTTFILSCLMFVLDFYIGLLLHNRVLALMIQIIVGAFFYIASSIIFKFNSFYYVLSIIKNIISRKRGK